MVSDLPVEVWLQILSFVPTAHYPKLVGINRTLFTLVMDVIYQEVRFMDDSEQMLKTFHQLKCVVFQPIMCIFTLIAFCRYFSISRRVQRVYIRPGFFLAMEKPHRVRFRLLRWGQKVPDLPAKSQDVIFAAQRGLANCRTVEELNIVMHDLLPPPSFTPFLKTLWTSFAPNLRQLTINATLIKFPLILKTCSSQTFPKLAELVIDLAHSRFRPAKFSMKALLRSIIAPFINILRKNLQSLVISSSNFEDITPLFQRLGHFPCLQKLGVHIPINHITFTDCPAYTAFIMRHRETLQHFTQRLPDAPSMYCFQSVAFETWLVDFCKLELPFLRSLHLGVSISRYPFLDAMIPLLSPTMVPQLVSLKLSDTYMFYASLQATFGPTFDGIRLESLSLTVEELSPQVFDFLSARLPHLISLDLSFKRRSVESLADLPGYGSYDVSV